MVRRVPTFPLNGYWWIPESPDQRVAGSLDQDDLGTLTLRTHSPLTPDNRMYGFDQTVYGSADDTPVTLHNAIWRRSEGGESNRRETWIASTALIGIHLEPTQRFQEIEATSEHLDAWVDAELFDRQFTEGTLRIERPTLPHPVSYGPGYVWVGHPMKESIGRKRFTITRATSLVIRPTDPVDLDGCLDLISHHDSLLDALLGTPTAASHLRLLPTDAALRYGGPELVGVMAQPRFAAPPDSAMTSRLCSFGDIGGLNGIAAWFTLGAEYRYLASRVTSHYRDEGRYLEDTAMAAFAAGEALDRAESRTENSKARTRWKRLASQIPEFIEDFALPDLDAWAHELVQERDRLAHLLGYETTDTDAHRMVALALSANLLGVLSLFRIAGLHESIPAMRGSYRWRDLRTAFENELRGLGLI